MAKKFTKLGNTDEAFEAGKQAEYDAFWDIYQDYGERRNYATAFAGDGWSKETFRPKYNIVIGDGYMCFRYHNDGNEPYDMAEHLKNLGITLDFRYDMQYAFSDANVSRIPPLVARTNMIQTFTRCKAVTIDKISVNANIAYQYTFSQYTALENLTIEGTIGQNGFDVHYSTQLSKESITSIINALSATTSGLSVTLSATAVNNAFTTDEWNAFIATKPNWTISLM